jgi:hypothetical protein
MLVVRVVQTEFVEADAEFFGKSTCVALAWSAGASFPTTDHSLGYADAVGDCGNREGRGKQLCPFEAQVADLAGTAHTQRIASKHRHLRVGLSRHYWHDNLVTVLMYRKLSALKGGDVEMSRTWKDMRDCGQQRRRRETVYRERRRPLPW